ncbi:MAG: cytochrome c [Acidimicrobiaceae bacterium]|jgi:mono/diheme cytochrome c family protein|nr:cytochrome c [Acidimicrobiaceae bacterium]MBT5850140.1 cytochrome c [Acidimicrobiaceae bacterium]
MAAQLESDLPDPSPAEVGLYLGTGAFFAFVLTAAIGLSIYGHHLTADARTERAASVAAAVEADDLERGADIFSLRCASCHGPAGEGGFGPSFSGVVERIPDEAQHSQVVHEGRGQMPAFEGLLSDRQIELVVRFERDELNG